MWEEKMTQEEDDLEEELNSLDIREDHGAEDSDVTPINTPPITPPVLYIKKYPPVKPPENDAIHSFQRYPKVEEFDCRSESSLSWGDDEFEVEATKQVGILFDQVDFLLYQEKAAVPSPNSAESVSDNPLDLLLYNKNLHDSNDNLEKVSLSDTLQSDEGFEEIHSGTSKQSYGFVEEQDSSKEEELQSPQKIFYYGKFMESSTRFNIEHLLVSDPSPELQDECSNWVEQFPHFRVRGVSVDPVELREQEDFMSKDQILQEDGIGIEETISCDGDFENLLPLVAYTSANPKKIIPKEPSKQVTSNSRVCSGSNDPEVLKEQVFYILFDKLWETVTKRIEPLLYQYARYIIEQSVQYSSLSREPSTRGSRIGSHRVSQKVNDDTKANNNSLLPAHIAPRPLSGIGKSVDGVNRPLSGIRRPSSALYRLQNSLVMPDIHQDELKELLQVSAKPLQSANNRMQSLPSSISQTRESSALSSRSHVSLPAVTTPRDNIQRPVSSKNLGNHLTPRRISNYSGSGEQRPSSTSSFHTRMRFQEKFQNLNRQSAIQELGTEATGYEIEDGLQEQPSPVWSRHIPFLPPIPDNAVIPLKHQVQQSAANTRENRTKPMLYVRGATMSASHRSDARSKSSKALCGKQQVEPFLSWVVERVDNEMQVVDEDQHLVVKNSLVHDDSESISMINTKQFRRYSHH